MKLGDIPLVGQVYESGAEDRVFDALLLVGPLVLALIAVVGRTAVTVGVAVVYLAVFTFYVTYNGLRR